MKVYAYLHPQLNILCCAVLPEAVPQGVQAIEFEVEDVSDVIYDGTQIRLKTPEEKLNERKQEKLQQLKQIFASKIVQTDYIFIKIEEAKLLNQNIQPLLDRYATQLQQRQQLRQRYEELKQAIQNATTLEELQSIVLEL
ncbi:TPA: conserved hypothetical protein [Thermocrinis Great Boiling Spring virus]|jgi:hypothetical protein|nr:TPA: conserved hypothetical protein [Thermocrinis Great Boiling Spring virus]